MFLPKLVGKVWDVPQRTNRNISSYKIASGEGETDAIPAGMEALIILYLENAYKKWVYEAENKMKWGRAYKPEDQQTDEYKANCPPTPHSTKKGGSNKYGGWTQEGRIAFAKYQKLIQQGRNKKTTKEAKDDMRLHLKQKHASKPKKKKGEEQVAIELSQTGIGFKDDMEEVLEEEVYDSDEEANAMRQVKENMNAKKHPSEGGATDRSSSKKKKTSRKGSADGSGSEDEGKQDS